MASIIMGAYFYSIISYTWSCPTEDTTTELLNNAGAPLTTAFPTPLVNEIFSAPATEHIWPVGFLAL